jgi:hypothetical protein
MNEKLLNNHKICNNVIAILNKKSIKHILLTE